MGAVALATVLSRVRHITAAALPIALGATMMWAGVLSLLMTTRASGQELNNGKWGQSHFQYPEQRIMKFTPTPLIVTVTRG